MITYEGYLIQAKLKTILEQLFPNSEILEEVPIIENKRWKYDYAIPSLKLFIEFDGDSHFSNCDVNYRDFQKDVFATAAGYKVIRIPYFIQLNSVEIINEVFGINYQGEVNVDYRCGFIDFKAMKPASFSSLGEDRFLDILDKIPSAKNQIIDSLNAHIAKVPKKYVLGTGKLQNLV